MELIEIFENIKLPATITHVISVIFGMGSALISDILFTFYSKDKKLNETEINTLSILSKVVQFSLIFIFLSGAILFLSDINKYLESSKFLSKMTILAVLLINGYFLNNYIWRNLLKKDFFISNKNRTVRRFAFVAGAISVVSWLSVCVLGILNSIELKYIEIMIVYIIIVAIGSIVSIIVENKKY
jgi:hypothetical protein